MASLKFSKFNFTAAVDNIYAQFAEVNKGLHSTYIMMQKLFRKYFRYARRTSLKFSKFNFSAAISNIYAQFAPVSRRFYSAYFTFQQRLRKYFLYARMASLKIKILISLLLLTIFMRMLRQ